MVTKTTPLLPLHLDTDLAKSCLSDSIEFVRETYQSQGCEYGVIAVSGGIDSAVSAYILTQALGADHVIPVLMPYQDQSMADAEQLLDFCAIPKENRNVVPIQNMVQEVWKTVQKHTQAELNDSDYLRLGNIQARVRMIVVYDLAKQLAALVCGTENKSEKYLGYFTRFGDEASDVEPIHHLFKTQVRAVAEVAGIPAEIITKAPSAGLWQNQTDEQELGFSYQVADQVLHQLVDRGLSEEELILALPEVDPILVRQVIQRVRQNDFKHQVPYCFPE